jgi:hypothetical protein
MIATKISIFIPAAEADDVIRNSQKMRKMKNKEVFIE